MQAAEKMIRHGDVTLATEAFGAAVKGDILLLMGSTASMAWWPDALIGALAAGGYRVIRFDHRDTGRSTTHAPGDVRYDVNDLAGDIIAILDGYGIAAAHVAGMSLGAYVAQIAALTHPERIRTLTLIAAEPLGVAYEGEGIAPEFMEHFQTMGALDWADRDAVSGFMLRIAELSAGPGRPFDSEEALARIHRELARTDSMQSAFNHAMVGGEVDPALTFAGITQPLLLIHGDKDPIIAVAAAHAAARAAPSATLLVLEGVGHELLARDAPRIAEAMLARLDG